MARDELCDSLRHAGGLDDLQRMRCARNLVVLGVRPPLTNPLACLLVKRHRRTSHHEEQRLPDLFGSTRIELPCSDARQLGLEEGGGIRRRLLGPAWNGAIGCWPPSRPEDDAEET